MTYIIDLQIACKDAIPVAKDTLIQWAQLPLQEQLDKGELTLRLVTNEEMIDLNSTYRKQHKTTNVLAFPSSMPSGIELDYPLLGDVIICPAVLLQESIEQHHPLIAHWAHIIMHGVLHLLGFDHIQEKEAHIMQALEIKLLATLGFDNPYHREDSN